MFQEKKKNECMTMWWETSHRYVMSDESQLICLYVPQNICIYIYMYIQNVFHRVYVCIYICVCVYVWWENLMRDKSQTCRERRVTAYVHTSIKEYIYLYRMYITEYMYVCVCVCVFFWWKYVMRDKS